DRVKRTARGCLVATLRAAERQRLTGNYAEFSVAVHHGNCVHDPGHGLRIRVNIGRRDVSIRPDDWSDLESIPAREPFEFSLRHALRITNYAALSSSIRNSHGGAFPGHP